MNVLGLSDGWHAGAALCVDGELRAVASEASFDRLSASNAFPWQSLDTVLTTAGLEPHDIDIVAMAGRFSPPFAVRRHPELRAMARDRFSPVHDARVLLHAFLRQSGLGAIEADRAGDWLSARLAERGFHPQRLVLVEIHRALAEAAYRMQDDTTDVLVMTAHPNGDGVALAAHVGNSAQLDRFWMQRGFAALHVHLDRCAAALGLRSGIDDSVLWGLASRGEPLEDLMALLDEQFAPRGKRLTRRSYMMPASRRTRLYKALASAPPEDAAASIVLNLARTMGSVVKAHVERWGIDTVALGGRVFGNPRVVSAIAELPEVSRVMTAPEPGFGSLAAGVSMMLGGSPPDPKGPLGPDQGSLDASELQGAAHVLAAGEPVLHLSGRVGWGPEGMGSQAALVRADDPAAVERLRSMLGRHVDEAPLVLISTRHLGAFRHGECLDLALRYGTAAPVVPASMARQLAGGTGRDGRARVALVESDSSVGALLASVEDAGGLGLVAFPLARGEEPSLISVARVRQLGDALGVAVAAGRVA